MGISECTPLTHCVLFSMNFLSDHWEVGVYGTCPQCGGQRKKSTALNDKQVHNWVEILRLAQ